MKRGHIRSLEKIVPSIYFNIAITTPILFKRRMVNWDYYVYVLPSYFQMHAPKSEQYLVGKNLLGSGVLAGVMSTLSQELNPAASAPGPSAQYKRTVAVALLYKVMCSNVSLKYLRVLI